MKPGAYEHDELLWRLAQQLAAQLPVDKSDKRKVLDYIDALSSDEGRVLFDEMVRDRKRRLSSTPGLRAVEAR